MAHAPANGPSPTPTQGLSTNFLPLYIPRVTSLNGAGTLGHSSGLQECHARKTTKERAEERHDGREKGGNNDRERKKEIMIEKKKRSNYRERQKEIMTEKKKINNGRDERSNDSPKILGSATQNFPDATKPACKSLRFVTLLFQHYSINTITAIILSALPLTRALRLTHCPPSAHATTNASLRPHRTTPRPPILQNHPCERTRPRTRNFLYFFPRIFGRRARHGSRHVTHAGGSASGKRLVKRGEGKKRRKREGKNK